MREHHDTIIIGGGQSGLVMGYQLQKRGVPFVILDANDRIGESWRARYDSLVMFTPAKFNRLSGMAFPAPRNHKPTKDEMAAYLEAYAERFALPIRKGVRVDGLRKEGERFVVTAGEQTFTADRVVVATGAFTSPRTPPFAADLDPSIVQIHARDYRSPAQLQPGGVLIVGAGNSGADICIETVRTHPTWLAGKESGHIPFRIDSFKARFLVYGVRFAGSHVLTRRTPIGRKVAPFFITKAAPLVRVKPKDIVAAGVQRVGRVAGAVDGAPAIEDGTVLDQVRNVIWCTGYTPDYGWIDMPITGDFGWPAHDRGVSTMQEGLYFIGLPFQYAATSDTVPGVSRDAEYLARRIARRPAPAPAVR